MCNVVDVMVRVVMMIIVTMFSIVIVSCYCFNHFYYYFDCYYDRVAVIRLFGVHGHCNSKH